jgi:hypothetical protein
LTKIFGFNQGSEQEIVQAPHDGARIADGQITSLERLESRIAKLDKKIEILEGEIAEAKSQPKNSVSGASDLRIMIKRLATLEAQQNILLSQKSEAMKSYPGRGAKTIFCFTFM